MTHECSGFLGILCKRGELHNISCYVETRKCNVRATYTLSPLGTPSLDNLSLSTCVELLQEEVV